MIQTSPLNEGDRIFLFSEFPFDYSIDLPFQIVPGIDLIARPNESELYSPDEGQRPYRYILPLLNVGIGQPKVCVRIAAKKTRNQNKLFWQLLLVLRLIRPLSIGVSGAFSYSKNNSCDSCVLFWMHTTIQEQQRKYSSGRVVRVVYTIEDFKLAAELFRRINGFKNKSKHFRRLVMAFNSFGQVTVGASTSYTMLYQELFSCLGILFATDNGITLGQRVGKFLEPCVTKSNSVKCWVFKNYVSKRSDLSHGNPDFWMNGNKFCNSVGIKQYSELIMLHEVVRECILGFLGFNHDQLNGHNDKKLNLEFFFKGLTANEQFLRSHKIRMKPCEVKQGEIQCCAKFSED